MLRMNSVGPPTKTMIARSTASTILMFDSHWMPFSMPEIAEATKQGRGAQQIFQRDDGVLCPVGFFGRFGGFLGQDAWEGHDTR